MSSEDNVSESAWQSLRDEAFEQHAFIRDEGVLPFRMYRPRKEHATESLPLVIIMHGAGERGADNQAQLMPDYMRIALDDWQRERPCYIVLPQCPADQKWIQVDHWDADDYTFSEQPSQPMALALGMIQQVLASTPEIDRRRIYVVGNSMGGYATWDIMARHPELVAAAVPICGNADSTTIPRIKDIPIWTFHGDKDEVIRPHHSRRMVAGLREVGAKVTYTEFPNVAHNSWTPALAQTDLWEWLFKQRKL